AGIRKHQVPLEVNKADGAEGQCHGGHDAENHGQPLEAQLVAVRKETQTSALPRQPGRDLAPVLLGAYGGDLQPGGFDGGSDLVQPPVENAGADKQRVGPQEVGDHRGQRDNHIGHNVGQHDIVAPLRQPLHGGPVADDVAGDGGKPVAVEIVEGSVLPGDIFGLGVDVHAGGRGRAKEQGCDGQNAAAAAQVNDPFAAPN